MTLSYITDLDGTLCDTLEANILSYQDAFNDLGIYFDIEAYRKNFGLRFDEMANTIAPNLTSEQKTYIHSRKSYYYKRNAKAIKPNHALIAILQDAKRHGSKIGLVTTAQKNNAIAVLQQLKIKDGFFDTIVFGEDVSNSKPSPECYTLAINRLKIKPCDCIVFEDSDIGISAAISAGAKVLRIKL